MNTTQRGSTFHLLPIILSLTTVYHVWSTERTYYSISSHHFVCKTVHHVRITEGTYFSFSPYHVVSYSWYKFDLLFLIHMFCTQNREDLLFILSLSFCQWMLYIMHMLHRGSTVYSLYHFVSECYILCTCYTEDLLFTFPLSFCQWPLYVRHILHRGPTFHFLPATWRPGLRRTQRRR